MNTDKQYHITAGEGASTVTILEGQALPQREPRKIAIVGNILAISAFLSARYGDATGAKQQYVDKTTALVVVDRNDMKIELRLDPNDEFGTVITGKMEMSDELRPFQINTTQQFTREALVKLLRFNSRFFASADEYDKLLQAFQKLNLSATAEISASNDTRGNKEAAFKKVINSAGIPESFVLDIPVFKGFPAKRFRVEVCLESTEQSVRFWFESVELHNLIIDERDVIINGQLEACKDFPVIEL